MTLLALSILLTLIGQLARIPLLMLIGYIPLGIGIFRTFSKNITKRSMENYKFAMLMSPVYVRYRSIRRRINDIKTHKHFRCFNCETNLRVPKGKGKILVTCPKCKAKFHKKT